VRFDASHFRRFTFGERYSLQFRAEGFNVMNHAQFRNPGATIGSSNYGMITSAPAVERQIRFGLRLAF
jgi:hypothetical protein